MHLPLTSHVFIAAATLLLAISPTTHCAESRLDFQPADSVSSLLGRQAGQAVELRLKSGEKIGGKLEKVGSTLVHLSQLTGAEFFEAVVSLDEIAAVVVRAKGK